MIRVYIAGPYTKGDVAINVNQAIKIANQLLDMGYIPFIPHLTHFWYLISPRPYRDWLKLVVEWLKLCHVVFRFEGESPGADKEVELAKLLGIPVVTSLAELDDIKETLEKETP